MKTINLIVFLIVSIITQILLIPIRILKGVFKVVITIFKIFENTTQHLIHEVEKEVLKKH
tara:strand:- start:166 stop:345 length:180 start_codon:yes stop_codon:yes gene_type:complete